MPPRPHNSGHYTLDACITSQFEQHLRAVLDYPLGDTAARADVTVMANVLGAPETPAMSVDERSREELSEQVELIEAESTRLRELIEGVMDLARPGPRPPPGG